MGMVYLKLQYLLGDTVEKCEKLHSRQLSTGLRICENKSALRIVKVTLDGLILIS